MAQTFGKYEVVAELNATAHGSVYSARPAGAVRPGDGGGLAQGVDAVRAFRELREVRYAVKVYNPTGLDLDELFWESQSFLERARLQQRTADAGNGNWAPVHEMGTSPAGAYYVTDFHPLSAASLVTGRVDVGPGVLYAIVRSVVAGLIELKDVAGRSHGNLKASNVLISSRGDVAVAGAVLSDPAPAGDAAKSGEAGDLQALGELIYLLVTGRPFPGGAAWPLSPSREWNRLGSAGAKQWRRLCNDLLDPDAEGRPSSLAAVARQLPRLAPRRPRRTRRAVVAAISAVLFIAVGATAMLVVQDVAARKEIYDAKSRWAGALAQTLAESSPRRRAIEADPDLRLVVQELASARLEQFDRPEGQGRFTLATMLPALWNLKEFPRTQESLAAVRRAERGLSPLRWRQLARAAELQGEFEGRGWGQPGAYLSQRVAAARPGSADLAGGIERLLRTLASVDRDLESAEAQWEQLRRRTVELDDTRDPVLKKFAELLHKAGAASVRLNETGFENLDGLARAAARAAELADARPKLGSPGDYDEQRFKDAVASSFIPAELTAADADRWLATLAAHAVKHAEIAAAAEELRKLETDLSQEVLDSRPDAQDKAEFDRQQAGVTARIAGFARQPFIDRDIVDGTFRAEKDRLRAEALSLRSFARREDVNEWLKTLNTLSTSSPRLNQAWESWRTAVAGEAPRRARMPEGFGGLKRQTQEFRNALGRIDDTFPKPSKGLDEKFAAAAFAKREAVFDSLLTRSSATDLIASPLALQAAAADYAQWAAELVELARHFPLQKELLDPDDRPEARWAAPDKLPFWNDPLVRKLVEPDVQRLANLRGLAARPRDDLARIAATSDRAEIVFHAWRLLGSDRVRPAWPTGEADLRLEARIRDRLDGLLRQGVKRLAERERAAEEITRQGPARWLRYAEAARDERMIASAAQLRDAFAVANEHVARLSPAARFNLALYAARQHIRLDKENLRRDPRGAGAGAGAGAVDGGAGPDEGSLKEVISHLGAAAAALRDNRAMAELGRRLEGVYDKEPFADRKPGQVFEVPVLGVNARLEMRRVEPTRPGERPFYLGTTEVSLAQFVTVLDAHAAWARMQSLLWTQVPGVRGDTRRGPRTWEWARPGLGMNASILWLSPDDANNFAPQLLDPASRFNRNLIAPAFGGIPSDGHPMQQLSAEAALYFAGLCGCRLPTPHEWKVAYEQFGKDVPPERWNLRDRTWDVQRRHAASAAAGDGVPPPDAGVYLPEDKAINGKPIPTGAAATAGRQDDRTLFFRTVNSAGLGGDTFRHLVGNVAELVCEGGQPFERYPERRTPDGVKRFAASKDVRLSVIGGSALSPPELPLTEPLPINPGAPYADVGFRLAFTAPSRSLGERLEWALGAQDYVFPAPARGPDTQASASTARSSE